MLQRFIDFDLYHSHIDDIRFGFGRCSSFFDFPITYGDVCAIYFSFLLFLFYTKQKVISKYVLYFTLISCLLSVILANSRASLLCFFVGLLHFSIKRNRFASIVGIVLLAILMSGYVIDNYNSIFNSNVSLGSDTDLRESQFLIALNEFNSHMLFGSGFDRLGEIQMQFEEAAGMESYLFVLMISTGLVGLVNYLLTWYYSFSTFPKYSRKVPFFIMTAWVLASFTSLTSGVSIWYPVFIIVILFKINKLNLVLA
ncbi:O-antigen ligase family protein [Segatella bryantii]|uniref:O-antigen ligase family protein n=1 Tax=Segatella bryantii TaxID=77095 RepID=UPI00241C4A74|nr:O-antigen ligase family protein [Segatella bryantii]